MTHTLKATTRTKTAKAAKHLLDEGLIPAVVYGHGTQNRSVEVQKNQFKKIYKEAGESSLVDLIVDDAAPVKVLIQDTQVHPLKNTVTHVDFHQVRMDQKLSAEIPLKFVGESLAVKGLGGTLVKNLAAIDVECLPGDLVHEIVVDISPLVTFDVMLRVKDLAIPKGIKVLDGLEEAVVFVTPPRSEEEMKALEGTVEASVESVEVVEKKKKQEEGEEEAPAADAKKAEPKKAEQKK